MARAGAFVEYNGVASAHAWRSSAANHGWSDQPLRTGDLALRHPATAERSFTPTIRRNSRLPQQDRLNIAVFIDFDNIEIGVRTTLSEHFDVGTILEALKERGEVVTKIAYADWTRAGEYSRALTQHAIRLVQRNLTPGGDKNGADINLALDALEMAFTHPHINAYVIVGGDSDFLSLVEKLKQYDKKVFVVGGRAFTSVILQRNCHEFIAYENLARKPAARGGRPEVRATATAPIAQAFPIVRRALKILADREVTPQTGLLKSTLLQLDSTFSERNYGAILVSRLCREARQGGPRAAQTRGTQRHGRAEPGICGRRRSRPPRRSRRRTRRCAPTPEAGVERSGVEADDQTRRSRSDLLGEARGHAGREQRRWREARRAVARRRHDRPLADVPAQRQADSEGRRVRRAPLRLRRADGSPAGVPAR